MKSSPNVASKQLQSRKKVQQKYRDIACKANFFPPYLRQAAKIYVATSYIVVRQETIEISEERTAFVWFFPQEVDWRMKDCDKQRLQTIVSINLSKILAGQIGDWFDVIWGVVRSWFLGNCSACVPVDAPGRTGSPSKRICRGTLSQKTWNWFIWQTAHGWPLPSLRTSLLWKVGLRVQSEDQRVFVCAKPSLFS